MTELPVNQILCGDNREVMKTLPLDSIDLVVTSPPYWGLRDYGEETVRLWGGNPECEHEWGKEIIKTQDTPTAFAGRFGEGYNRIEKPSENTTVKTKTIFCSICGAWRGSLGLEPHPQLFIDHLVEICREIRRVMKSSGTFWLNLGDTYCSSGKWVNKELKDIGKQNRSLEGGSVDAYSMRGKLKPDGGWIQPKQLLMIPARVAIALQNDGWILRNDIIWHKPNHMPSSVKDRLTCAYEHIFLFAKHRRYYFDLDAIRKPFSKGTLLRIEQPNIDNQLGGPKTIALRGDKPKSGNANRPIDIAQELSRKFASGERTGKNPGDLWRVPTNPFPGAHFSTFPPKLIEPMIKAGCPRWICSRCGKPRTRITEPTPEYAKKLGKSVHDHKDDLKIGMRYDKVYNAEYVTVGWSDCGCGANWVGGIVLDPFAGSGTALRVAHKLSRRFIGIEINSEYAEMARRRVRSDKYSPAPEGVPKLSEIFSNE